MIKGDLDNTDPDEHDKVMQVNLGAVFNIINFF